MPLPWICDVTVVPAGSGLAGDMMYVHAFCTGSGLPVLVPAFTYGNSVLPVAVNVVLSAVDVVSQ